MTSQAAGDVDFDVDGTFIESRDGRYVCMLCTFESADKTTVTSHVDVVHRSNWFKCDVARCSFVAATKRALNRHKASEHLQQLQMTSFTRAAPSGDSSLIYDQETGGLQGHGSGMWQCHICPDKTLYRYRRSYEKHMAKHKGFVEPSIEAQSHREYALASIMSDPTALACFICGAHGFEARTDLQAHLLQAHALDASDSSSASAPPPLTSCSEPSYSGQTIPPLPAGSDDVTQEQLDVLRHMMQPHRGLSASSFEPSSSSRSAAAAAVAAAATLHEHARAHTDSDAARHESSTHSRSALAGSSSNGASRRPSRHNRKSFPRRLTSESADDDTDDDGGASAVDLVTSRAATTSSSKRLKLK